MIKKIDISNFGAFEEYEWKKHVGNEDDAVFKSMNIIYGRNYAGKTTLSRIFRCLELQELHKDFERPGFNILLQNGRVINQDNIKDQSNLKIRVYNTDFVKSNLSWFYNDEGTIQSFAVLGEQNVEIEKEILKLRNELGSIETKKGLLYEESVLDKELESLIDEKNKKCRELDEYLRKKAQDIKNASNIYNVPTYNITSIKQDIKIISTTDKLNDQDIEIRRKLLKEDARREIHKVQLLTDEFLEISDHANFLLTKNINPSEPILDLINNKILQTWVREGIGLHKEKRDSCGFCGNLIDNELWERLDKHFNQESEKLRNEMDICVKKFTLLNEKISQYSLPDINNFYSDSRQKYSVVAEDFDCVKRSFLTGILTFIQELNERIGNIFEKRSALDIVNYTKVFNAELIKVNQLIVENNNRTLNLYNEQAKAREELLKNEVARFSELIEYTKNMTEISKMDAKIKEFKPSVVTKKDEISEKILKISQFEEQLEDESRGAALVNEHLSNFFGHNALMLVSEGQKPNIKFKILRDGREAKNLSEGECSLISFCYFIARLEDELQSDKDRLIIYIDDPISSLDGNHIYFTFSLIESVIAKNRDYRQLFISTHNLDFLKYLKRLSKPNDKTDINYFLIERRMKKNIAGSFLIKMPKHIRDYVTEFNYLFNELYSVYKQVRGDRKKLLENTYNQFYNLPNNIRKFLECYLFYKYPNNKNPIDNLHRLFDEGNIPALINRVINEGSHLVYIDRGWKPIDVEEMEKCVCIIMEKILEKDPEQYNALLESIGQMPVRAVELVNG